MKFFLPLFFLALTFWSSVMPSLAEAATLARPANNLGLQAYWSFDEGTGTRANGIPGTINTGTVTGATWAPGKRNSALSFNGTSDKVTGGPMTVGTNMTISAWVKKTSSTSQRSFFSNRGTGGTVYFGLDGTQVFLYDNVATPASFKTSVGSVQIGQWQHVVVTSNGSVSTVYVNGAFVASTTQTRSSSTGVSFGIGWDPSLATEYWGGSIDEVRVYNRVLSAAEVSALYSSGDVVQKIVPRTGLIGEWLFNEGTSTQARDTSGKNNNGSIVNPSWTMGKHAKALTFDGSSSYGTGNGTGLPNNGASGNITISGWVNPSSTSGTRTIFSKGASASCFNYGMVLVNGVLSARNTNLDYAVASSSVSTNKWTFVTVVYTSSGAQGYINGVSSGTNVNGVTSNCSTTNWTIGTRASNSLSEFFSGILDDMRVYNRALSATEIQSLYKERTTAVNSSQNGKLTNGLVGLWSFDGPDVTDKVYDRSGQGNDGYIMGGVATSSMKTIGKIGQALRFNGISSYVQVANSGSLNPTNLTVSTWAKSDTSTWSNFGFLVSKRLVYIIHPQQGSTGVNFYIYTTGWSSVSCTPTTAITKWNLYSFTWNGTNLTAYINGVQCSSTTPAGPINTTDTNPLYFGMDSGNRYLNGALDDVRIYNRALSSLEIKQLYLMGK